MIPATFQPVELLRVLRQHEVEFVVVGMGAAILHGATTATGDINVVYSRTPENVPRSLATLTELEARFRKRPDIFPDRSYISSRGHKLLTTKFGDCDFLGYVGPDLEYPDLVDKAVRLSLVEFEVDVVELRTIIELKEHANREKDRAALPGLRALLKTIEEEENGQT